MRRFERFSLRFIKSIRYGLPCARMKTVASSARAGEPGTNPAAVDGDGGSDTITTASSTGNASKMGTEISCWRAEAGRSENRRIQRGVEHEQSEPPSEDAICAADELVGQ